MDSEQIGVPRVLIAGLRGGSGKTVVSIGIASALARKGGIIAPFKKGPDYIDAGWLAMAAGRPCHNLDPFLVPPERLCRCFLKFSKNADLSLIEGNRGLYDGLDAQGTTSTASLAGMLGAPVILCVDCTKTTRTMAAVILGCMNFDPGINICGVVLNRVSGARHERILRESIEECCGIPVIGVLPRLGGENFPERHMGLIPAPEHRGVTDAIDSAANVAASGIDLDRIVSIAESAASNPLQFTAGQNEPGSRSAEVSAARVAIGVVRDSAFQFYYPENLEALEAEGAELVYLSPLQDRELGRISGLYLGGGFPETHAEGLSGNSAFRNAVKKAAEAGLPVYAECGGLMYLGRSLVLDKTYPMAGVLPVVFGFSARPQGHGYTVARVETENPYFRKGTEIRGHEFHYSRVLEFSGSASDLALQMRKGRGIVGGRDGMCYKNVFAAYTHIHSQGLPEWAGAFVRAAAKYKQEGLK